MHVYVYIYIYIYKWYDSSAFSRRMRVQRGGATMRRELEPHAREKDRQTELASCTSGQERETHKVRERDP